MTSFQEIAASTTNRLVAANVAIYFVLQAFLAGAPSGFELYFWQNPAFQLWQPISYMFLHATFTHLLFNMIALWSFGRVLERVWGGRRMLIFFLVCGVGAALVHLGYSQFQFQSIYSQLQAAGFADSQIDSVYLAGRDISAAASDIDRGLLQQFYTTYHTPAVGASGAVYGILVAFALLFPDFKVILIFLPIPVAARYFVPVLLLIDLSAGITGVSLFGYNIAHFAHLGGALAGFLMVQYWLRHSR
ncbi:MAG: rhomboid family intramembrane serine protease [Arenicella sp.]|nr:rhomboid family intramembrane serine protease [Arenicella sp.]